MKVIAGLGNPGTEYKNTPHNVGFDVVEAIAVRLGAEWKDATRFRAHVAKTELGGETLWLMKPQTFMNASGEAIAPFLRYYHASASDLIVVEDDTDLPLGKLRLRAKGSSGGHRGLGSVINQLGTESFIRVRLGVGRTGKGSLIPQVLGKFGEDRRDKVAQLVGKAAEAALCIAEKGLNEAMNRYNGWGVDDAEAEVATAQ